VNLLYGSRDKKNEKAKGRIFINTILFLCPGRDLLSAKDNRILELSEQVAELGRKVFDLEENLREKDEVIAARSASIRPPVCRLNCVSVP
jgi:hypothetical protein